MTPSSMPTVRREIPLVFHKVVQTSSVFHTNVLHYRDTKQIGCTYNGKTQELAQRIA